EPGGESAPQLLLIDRARGFRPLVDRRGVEGGEASVGAPAEVRHHRMGVELRVTLAAGAVHEGGGGDARRRPPAFAVDHLAGCPGPALHEVERHRHGLDMGDRGHRRDLRAGEGPQQRHALGRGERQIERRDLPAPVSPEEADAGPGLVADQQGPQVVGVHHPDQPETGGQAPLPDAGRLAGPDVVILDADRHRIEKVFGVPAPGDSQHDARPGNACGSWQVSVDRLVMEFRVWLWVGSWVLGFWVAGVWRLRCWAFVVVVGEGLNGRGIVTTRYRQASAAAPDRLPGADPRSRTVVPEPAQCAALPLTVAPRTGAPSAAALAPGEPCSVSPCRVEPCAENRYTAAGQPWA